MSVDYQSDLLRIAQQQELNANQYEELKGLVSPPRSPEREDARFRGLALLFGGLCLGLAVIFWVAANWGVLTNFEQFALVEAVLAVSLVAGVFESRFKSAFLLMSVLALGGLLALYAQVYSSNADSWRLFAFWAALALPIALVARHQSVWVLWLLITLLAHSLWWTTLPFRYGSFLGSAAYAWAILLVFVGCFYPRGFLKSFLGSFPALTFRIAACFAMFFIASTSMVLIIDHETIYTLCVGCMFIAGIVGVLYVLKHDDLLISCIGALCIDILLLFAVLKILLTEFNIGLGGWIGMTFLLGVGFLFMLWGSLKIVIRMHKNLTLNAVDDAVDSQESEVKGV